MSISQTTPERTLPGEFHCPHCNVSLPPHATFCGSCGERLDKKKQVSSLLQDEQDITERYRITSLVRRRPYVNLYLALDNQYQQIAGQQHMVAIRDIDISILERDDRAQAVELAQQEYDLLHKWRLPHVMAAIDLRYFQGHLFLVSGNPGGAAGTGIDPDDTAQRLFTLQDYLQSGQGIPAEARTLEWIGYLSRALQELHTRGIVIGDLDPYTIILNSNSDRALPTLMVSWLVPQLREMLPPPTPSMSHMSYFSAPEALLGKAEVRSDVYSLGALLYLLLTGTPPDESTLRNRRRLRTPHELNSRIRPHVDECVMQALSVEPEERFPSILALTEALQNPRYRRPQINRQGKRESVSESPEPPENDGDVETVQIVPLSRKALERWQTAQTQTISPRKREEQPQTPLPPHTAPPVTNLPETWAQAGEETHVQASTGTEATEVLREEQKAPEIRPAPSPIISIGAPIFPAGPERQGAWPERSRFASQPSRALPSGPSWKQRLTKLLPAIVPERKKVSSVARGQSVQVGEIGEREERAEQARPALPLEPAPAPATEGETSWLKQLQRLILGQQQHTVMAAAIIETPLRVQPNQGYTLRLHIMGRDEPAPPPETQKSVRPTGLSALVHGDTVLIEVRSALHHSYTYLVQQATVTVPAAGYAAEVTIPMQPLSSGPSGRRDRLHIFFLDEQRRPLYEKPFVVELFVSHLVQFGREGHHVLTIPI